VVPGNYHHGHRKSPEHFVGGCSHENRAPLGQTAGTDENNFGFVPFQLFNSRLNRLSLSHFGSYESSMGYGRHGLVEHSCGMRLRSLLQIANFPRGAEIQGNQRHETQRNMA